MSDPFNNKTALITGATRGLGQHLCLELAKKGANIIAIGRTVGALEDLDDKIKTIQSKKDATITLVPLDLCETETIDALGPTLFSKFDKLDILISNAAYLGGLAPISHFKTEEWNKLITTNLTANFALIRTLDPLLKRSANANAIFITDNQSDIRGTAYWGPYTATKAALEIMVNAYAAELRESNIKACLINPGPMATNLRRNAYPGEDQSTLATPASKAEKLINILSKNTHKNGETITL